jgi:hypothetical protein
MRYMNCMRYESNEMRVCLMDRSSRQPASKQAGSVYRQRPHKMPDAPRTRKPDGPLTAEEEQVLKERRKRLAEEEAAYEERERAERGRHKHYREKDKNTAQQLHDKQVEADRPEATKWQEKADRLYDVGEANKLRKQAERAAQAKREKRAEVLVKDSDEDEVVPATTDEEASPTKLGRILIIRLFAR